MTDTLAAATHQYPNGWGGPIAILIPFLVLWAATTGHRRWQEARQGDANPSAEQKTLEAAKPQITDGSGSDDSGPADGGGEVVPLRQTQLKQYVAERVDKQNTAQIVKDARRQFKVSERTVYRIIDKVRNGGAA
jgi:hypothetical protein